MGTAALVLGILAILLAFLPIIGLVSYPLSVVGVIFGSIGLNRVSNRLATNKAVALIGLITSAVGFVLVIIATVVYVGSIRAAASSPIVSGAGPGSPAGSQAIAPPKSRDDALTIERFGFGQDKHYGNTVVEAVAVIKNSSPIDKALLVAASFTAYDAAGKVVGTGDTTISIIRAGQTLAASADVLVQGTANVDHIVAQASAQRFDQDPNPSMVLSGRNSTFTPGDFGAKVDGELSSSYKSDLKDIEATAVCFDASKTIVGGGYTFVPLMPGGGMSGASVSVTVSRPPVACEIYGSPTSLSGPFD